MTLSARPIRVWATRPQAQNAGWCELLRQGGFASFAVPVLAIEAVQEPQQRQAIKNLILDFDQFDKVIFVSQNAVRETLVWLDEYWPQLPQGIQYFAVGQKTAEALQARGIAAVSCNHAMDSDELLAMPELQAVATQKILLCRGCGGRPRLAEALQARGAKVVFGEFYHRTLPSGAVDVLRNSDLLGGRYREILSVFSGESLSNLIKVLDAAHVQYWRDLPLLVPGERVAQQAFNAGFVRVITAINATDAAMLGAMQHWLAASQDQAHS